MNTKSSKFEYSVCPEISKLAWCCILEKEKSCKVLCGEMVEITHNAFVEGAWDDDFASMNFDKADFFCGSGGKVFGEGYLFVTPSHTLEKLVSIRIDNTLYISNSVPFVLAVTGSGLDIGYSNYERDFSSIIKGLNYYTRSIPLTNNRSLNLYYYCNVIVDKNLNIESTQKQSQVPIKNFEQYYMELLASVKAINKNATAYTRKHTYGLVSTISSGYDAAACSVVAKQIGCKKVLTFNAPEKYAKDSGEEIAKKLGFTDIVKKNANEYLKREDYVEAEHVCTGELGTTIIFSAFEDDFRNNIVFYGERGDKLWNKNWEYPNNCFDFTGELFAGISMAEYRLRVGFILLPLPLFKASVWESIHELSNSIEMQPWSIGGNYDRPIPRRIVEEFGVDRQMFGQEKKGAGFNYHFDNLSYLKTRMSEISFKDFSNFYRCNKRKGHYRKILFFYFRELPMYMNFIMKKVGIKYQFNLDKKERINNPGAPSYLINWGVEKMKKKYLGEIKKNEKYTFIECRYKE